MLRPPHAFALASLLFFTCSATTVQATQDVALSEKDHSAIVASLDAGAITHAAPYATGPLVVDQPDTSALAWFSKTGFLLAALVAMTAILIFKHRKIAQHSELPQPATDPEDG